MTLTPFLDAPLIVQIHAGFAVPALLLGPLALFARTGWRLHRIAGYAWLTAMTGLAVSGLLIPAHDWALIGPVGPIHLVALWTLWGLAGALRLARRGQIAAHRREMKSIWFGAMGVAGLLTLLPGRTINRMVFGAPSEAGYLLIAVGLVLLALLLRHDRGANLDLRTARPLGSERKSAR